MHDIDVIWYKCDIGGCDKQFKRKGNLKSHQAYVHDIDVVWHECHAEDCHSRFKRRRDLRRHQALIHKRAKWPNLDATDPNDSYSTDDESDCEPSDDNHKHIYD